MSTPNNNPNFNRGDTALWTHGSLEALQSFKERVVLRERQGQVGFMVKTVRDGDFHYARIGELQHVN